MSRIAWLVCACGLALATAPVPADDRKPAVDTKADKADAAKKLVAALKEKVEIDGKTIGTAPLFEVLQPLAKKHNVVFIIMEEEFRAKGIDDARHKVSRVKEIDTKDLTLGELLNAWLPGLHAMYAVREDHIAIVPLQRVSADAKEEPKAAKKKGDPTEQILDALAKEFVFKEGANINEIPLFELFQYLGKQCDIPFVINEESFKVINVANIREGKSTLVATKLAGGTLHQFLSSVLDSVGATYLVRNGVVEIVPVSYAAKVTKSATSRDEDSRVRLSEPLVSAIVKEKPLNEVVAKIAEQYDLTVIVAPQAADAKAGFVTARLLNVPADKAIELLALQCDLRVVRRGTAYFLTSRDHANELFGEKLDKERQQIELQKLRETPAVPPGLLFPPGIGQPAPAPAPKPPEKAPEK